MTPSPVTMRGTGVQTSVSAGFSVGATVGATVGSAGGFTVRFGESAGARCTGFSVTATGDRGSRASFTRLPEQCGALP